MSENMGEHHSAHHASKESGFGMYVLPLSILLAAVILGYSMMNAATVLNNGLSNITIAGGSGDTVLPTPAPGQGDLQPGITQTMAELSQNGAASLGSESAPIVLVEYSDYQCPFCRRWFDDSKEKLVQNYVNTGKVQFIYKDFPLSFHPMALPSANAVRCAGDQGKYWELHDAMYIEQGKLDPSGTVQYTLDDIKTWASGLGMNMEQFNACVDSQKYSAEIQANMAEGQAVGVGGTPSFVLGLRNESGQLIVGAQPYATFESALNALVEQAN